MISAATAAAGFLALAAAAAATALLLALAPAPLSTCMASPLAATAAAAPVPEPEPAASVGEDDKSTNLRQLASIALAVFTLAREPAHPFIYSALAPRSLPTSVTGIRKCACGLSDIR